MSRVKSRITATPLRLHWRWLLAGASVLQVLVVANLALGQPKQAVAIDGWDIAGEGGAVLLASAWVLLVLSSRPAGRVTNFLAAGLLALLISFTQDFLDELVELSAVARWEAWVESASMPIGMICVTFGLYLWRAEQLAILRQLRKRERIFRRHQNIDGLTQIPDLDYLREQIVLEQTRHESQPCSLLLLDVNGFAKINRNFGQLEGDRLLQTLSELLILNLRDDDLLCRYAGDRFAILLPDTTLDEARAMATELLTLIDAFTFRSQRGESIRFGASVGVASHRDNSESLLERAARALRQIDINTGELRIACA